MPEWIGWILSLLFLAVGGLSVHYAYSLFTGKEKESLQNKYGELNEAQMPSLFRALGWLHLGVGIWFFVAFVLVYLFELRIRLFPGLILLGSGIQFGGIKVTEWFYGLKPISVAELPKVEEPKTTYQAYKDHATNVLNLYIAPALSVLIGIAFILVPFFLPPLDRADFHEVRGYLDKYELYQDEEVKRRISGAIPPRVLISLQGGVSFWTNALDKESSEVLLKEQKTEIRTYLRKSSSADLVNGKEIKAYGLWINGQEIVSFSASIDEDEFFFKKIFPALGIMFFFTAFYAYRYGKKNFMD
jgi:hypothetical protein